MSNKKDILFLCQYFYPEYISSATLPYDTAQALVKEGFSVDVICGYPKEYNNTGEVKKTETYEGIGIKRLKYLQLKRSNFVGRLINYFSFTFSVSLKFMQLSKYKTITVYSNPPVLPFIAAIASKLYGTKMIFVSYDIYPEIAIATNTISENSIMNKIMRLINRPIFKHVNTVVALSSEMKECLLENREAVKDHQIKVIPNWYEEKNLGKSSESYQNKLFKGIKTENNLVVSYFGNMGTAQDLATIIEAIRGLSKEENVKFIFAGHGNKMELLKKIVKKESLESVKIFDFLHEKDFNDALNISDCFIVSLEKGVTGLAVPSKSYSYMMAGKPVIAIMGKHSDIAKDLVENEAGYALEVGEVSTLVNAIKELRDNKVKRDLMGEKSRELFSRKYTKEICTQKYVHMMKEILEGR